MKIQKPELSIHDFEAHPVWRFDSENDLFSPLESLDTQIGSIEELHFACIFTAPSGLELKGSVAGKGDTAVGIYCNGRWYAANKEWKQASLSQLDALANANPHFGINSGREFLPLRFRTVINKEPYIDWVGEFDLP